MRQTLFHISHEIAGVPLFGAGLLLGLWLLFSIGIILYSGSKNGWASETWNTLPLLALVGGFIWLILPRLCEPEGLPIRGYGTMLLVAVSTAISAVVYRAKRRGIDSDTILTLAFWILIPGILGARLFYVIQYWEAFQRPTIVQTLVAVVNIAGGGLVVYGSIIGSIVGCYFFFLRSKMPVLPTFDVLAGASLIGLALGRVGCLLNGCCFGGPCDADSPLAITFPPGSPAHIHQIDHGEVFLQGLKVEPGPAHVPIVEEVEPGSAPEELGIEPGFRITHINGYEMPFYESAVDFLATVHRTNGRLSIKFVDMPEPVEWETSEPEVKPVVATQLLSALSALFVWGFILIIERLFLRHDGQTFAVLLFLYPLSRFMLEIVRVDESGQFGTALTISQWVSIALMSAGVGLFIYVTRTKPGRMETIPTPNTKPEEDASEEKKKKSGKKK